jgi:DNA polymerase III subunit delta
VAKKASTPAAPLTAQTRIAVLAGKEDFLQSEHTARLRELLEAAHGEVDTVRFDGLTTSIADVLDECRTFGLMQQHKLIVVDHAEQLVKEDNRPLMERYADAPSETATLVLRCERWFPGKLDAKIHAVGTIMPCDHVTPAMAATWGIKRCEKRHEAVLERAAAEMLVDRIGVDLGRLDSELAKLAVAAAAAQGEQGGKPNITPAFVEMMVGLTREEEAWAIQETLLQGDPVTSLGHLRAIMDASRRDAHIPLSWAMLDLARKLHAASRGLREGANPWELGSKLKLWPEHRKEAVFAAARRVPPERLARLFRAAVEADMRQKSGFGRPERTLEMMAVRFARTLSR